MIAKRLCTFLTLWIVAFQVHSQFHGKELSWEKMIQGKSAYISKEKLELNIHGKGNLDSYGNDSKPGVFEFTREVTFVILKKDAIHIFNEFKLPENFDPTYIAHGPSIKNLGVYYSGYKVKNFEVLVKRNRKKSFRPKIKKKVKNVESFNLDYLYEYDIHTYDMQDIRVGDEVTIKYNIDIPFDENYSRFASYRMFFHDSIPKKKFQFTLSHHESLDLELYRKNGLKANRSYLDGKIKYRVYDMENMPGCLMEPNSRPYAELPHITWVINHYRYYVHSEIELQNVPHYAIIASMKARELPDIMRSIEIGSKSPQFIPFDKKFRSMTQNISPDLNVMKHMHTRITEDFSYDRDVEFYQRDDLRGERLGEYFANEILRDQSRYNIYYAILTKARVPFYSAFLIDKRYGEISREYFQPTFDGDFMITTYFEENLYDYMLPKRSKAGWYYNELPFYWEDADARLVHISDYATYRSKIKETFRKVRTNSINSDMNRRKMEFQVQVDLDSDSLYFDGTINLSGQYSTLGRMTYMGKGGKDKTVNIYYHKPIWKTIEAKKKASELRKVSSDAPFEAEFHVVFQAGERVNEEEGVMELDLRQFFPHALPKFNQEVERFTVFHSDFQGVDEITYELQFARPVTLETPIDVSMKNDFGAYMIRVTQESPVKITLTSMLKVHSSNLSPAEIQNFREIAQANRDSNKLKIKLK